MPVGIRVYAKDRYLLRVRPKTLVIHATLLQQMMALANWTKPR